VVNVSSLGKKYGSRWIFRNLQFDLNQGECLIVGGNNGSGKSTLLKILAGLEPKSEGMFQLEISDYRNELAYSALDQSVFPNLSVLEHLRLAADMRGIQTDHHELIKRVGLNDHIHHQSQHLSSGLRSRLKIALAIQPKPKILLWDEPGVALDQAGRELIESVVSEQRQRGVVVIATNDPDERRFGNYALELN
jgi:heme exporter protein A